MQKHSGSAQTTVRKGGETYRLRMRGSGLTAIEKTLRGERMCANTGRICGDNVQEMHRQRKRSRQWRQVCSEMRTEGTS